MVGQDKRQALRGAAAVAAGSSLGTAAFLTTQSGQASRQPQLRSGGTAAPSVGAPPSSQEPLHAGPSGTAATVMAASGLAATSALLASRQRSSRKAASALAARAAQKTTSVPFAPSSHVGPTAAARSAGGSSAFMSAPIGRGVSTTAVTRAAVAEAPVEVAAYTVGQKLHGWTCERVEHVSEFGCTGYLFKHDRTGAELMSMVQPADENKTFGVVFRTPPENSNGIAHVLEHSVLCGSRKYPLKEPFVELLKSSLQTFLNAMTFPDRTCYPVASCNLQDFYNLIDVYLDAVLHPRAISDPRVLAQEGWHYEIENDKDDLVYKGVVFNEMKGVYSSADSAHGRLANQSLFPDNAYGVDSGGDPEVIPTLTFDYMKDFHGKYYHPSNAKFWFYGDDPADKRLELLDSFLKEFEPITVDSNVKLQPLFKESKRVRGEFAVGEDEDISKKMMVSINWVVAEQKLDLQTSLALSFLNYLLMGTAASPLYKALVDSGLGSRVIGGGLYDGLLQPTFAVGLKDLAEADAPKVEELVFKTLQDLAEKGFEEEAVKAAINTIEFRNRELNTGGFPRGLALMFAAVENWNYGEDPFEPLRFEQPLADLKDRLAKGEKVFETLIKDKLLDNTHRVVVESVPNKEHGKKVEEKEKAKLKTHRETLSAEDINVLIEETKTLKEIQEKPDDSEAMAKVPRLDLSDIPKETPKIPTEAKGESPTKLIHVLPTSGVVYLDIAFDLSFVPEQLRPLLPLFTSALKQLGTAKGDFVSLTRRVDMSTGGISASTVCMNRRGQTEPEAYLVVRGKAMAPNVPDLVDLISEIALTVDLNNRERFVQLLRQAKSASQSGIISGGHVIAARRLGAQTTQAGALNESLSGLAQFETLSAMLNDVEAGGWDKVSAQLKDLQSCIFNAKACKIFNITCDSQNVSGAESALDAFKEQMPSGADLQTVQPSQAKGRMAEGIIVPTQVNYVGKGGNLYEAGYELHGSSLVISKFLGATYLWDRVRVSGGAYGGFCQFDPRSGDFKFLSYRDPNLAKTWENYDGAPEFLKTMELGEDELTKAIIGCMGDVDSYMLPDAKGYQAMLRHLLGEGDDYRQRLRDQILSTSATDFQNFAGAIESVTKTGGLCVVGSKDAIDAAKDQYDLSLVSPFAAAQASE